MSKATSWPAYQYRGTVVTVHDGDTCTLDLDLGFDVSHRAVIRLLGCNAIELAQPGGREAARHLAELLPPGAVVTVATVRPDKFGGRYDATVTLSTGVNLVASLIEDGWAVPWTGSGAKPVPAWPRKPAPTH